MKMRNQVKYIAKIKLLNMKEQKLIQKIERKKENRLEFLKI